MFLYGAVFFFQAEDGIRDSSVTGVQTCALPISGAATPRIAPARHARAGAIRGVAAPARVRATERAPANLSAPPAGARGRDRVGARDRKSVGVGKECRSRWSPYH